MHLQLVLPALFKKAAEHGSPTKWCELAQALAVLETVVVLGAMAGEWGLGRG